MGSRTVCTSAQAKWPQEVVALGDVVGHLTPKAASHLGLGEGLPVAQGGADAFIGMGKQSCGSRLTPLAPHGDLHDG